MGQNRVTSVKGGDVTYPLANNGATCAEVNGHPSITHPPSSSAARATMCFAKSSGLTLRETLWLGDFVG